MAVQEHLDILRQGTEIWNAWRKQNPHIHPNLSPDAELSDDSENAGPRHEGDSYGVDLAGGNFSSANFAEADLSRANLAGANLSRANFYKANLTGAKLDKANIAGASFLFAWIYGASMFEIAGAPEAKHLDNTRTFPPPFGDAVRIVDKNDVRYFETCHRGWIDRYLDWELIRTIGKIPLFGLSYTALILIPVVFYLFALYNQNIASLKEWAEGAKQLNGEAFLPLAELISQSLDVQPVPSQSLILLCSTVLLAIAATLFLLCPSRVRQFSQDQWTDELGRSLVHYWPLAWKYRWARITCALCFALGGFGALLVIVTKMARTAAFIWDNSSFPWYVI